jgi:uncharacterized membrane protein
MSESHANSRLEAFCDGVFAIALTLLIIDIKIPSSIPIHTTADVWQAIKHLAPSMFTFALSFVIIFITWVNHHASLKIVNKSSASFIYANGLLLITVVFLPFPTSLMGEYILTDHAAPAVILYNSTVTLQSVGWILLATTVLKDKLYINENAVLTIRKSRKYGYMAFVFYSLSAIIAFWFPLAIAFVTTFVWIYWLIWGINMKHE